MVWTVLWEITGHGASWGPLAFKFGPMIGGWRYWTKLGTLRLPPYPGKVPGTAGDQRTIFDVGLYLLILANLVFLLVGPGVQSGAAYSEVGLLPGWALISYVTLILVMGFRDKVLFLASRPEQYAVCLLPFGVLASHVDMVLVAKIAMVTIWLGAGVSDDLLAEMFQEIERLDCSSELKLRLLHHLAGWLHRYVDWITRVVLDVHDAEQKILVEQNAIDRLRARLKNPATRLQDQHCLTQHWPGISPAENDRRGGVVPPPISDPAARCFDLRFQQCRSCGEGIGRAPTARRP